MANEACDFYKRLASLLCEKWSEPYADGFDAACLSLCYVLPSDVWEDLGSSSAGSFGRPVLTSSVELVQVETGLTSLIS